MKFSRTLLAVFFLTNTAFAKEDGFNIGTVDMQRIILTVDEGKEARSKLEAEIKAKESEFLKQKQELDKMNKDWKDQSPLLSEEARIRKQQEFQEKFVQLRNSEMEFQAEIKKKENQETQKIAVKVSGLVTTLADEKKLDAVFETNSSGLMYAKQRVDLTEDVIKKYNASSPVKPSESKEKKPDPNS
ncbi:MAG: OmpH family outer membrane protein [Deltaproteobacteria bacterium]|nr:OmpH family outer membrane protein [Deltaproteobacteria bacterium]